MRNTGENSNALIESTFDKNSDDEQEVEIVNDPPPPYDSVSL